MGDGDKGCVPGPVARFASASTTRRGLPPLGISSRRRRQSSTPIASMAAGRSSRGDRPIQRLSFGCKDSLEIEQRAGGWTRSVRCRPDRAATELLGDWQPSRDRLRA
jgi:hypothetical protein